MKERTVIYNIRTDEYSVYCEERTNNEFVCEVFVKFKECIKHMVHVYFEQPNIPQMLLDIMNYGVPSKRPYKAGQSCDGSICSPTFHLYSQLCKAFYLDPIECYNLAYDDDEHLLTQDDLASMIDFAEWQGVEVIKDWSNKNVFRVLDSLTEVNNHQLRSILEDKLSHFIHQ